MRLFKWVEFPVTEFPHLRTLTDSAGRYTITGVPLSFGNQPTSYPVGASAAAHWPDQRNILAACGLVTPADFSILPYRYGTAAGTVAEGVPTPPTSPRTGPSRPPARSLAPGSRSSPAGSRSAPSAAAPTATTSRARSRCFQGTSRRAYTSTSPTRRPRVPPTGPCSFARSPSAPTRPRPPISPSSGAAPAASAGTVVSTATGQPVAGALVVLRLNTTTNSRANGVLSWLQEQGSPGTTDAAGTFTLTNVSLGYNNASATYHVEVVSAPGHQDDLSRSVTIPRCGDQATLTPPIALNPLATPTVPAISFGALRGRVFDQETGQPVAGVTVSAIPRMSGGAFSTAQTDATGTYAFAQTAPWAQRPGQRKLPAGVPGVPGIRKSVLPLGRGPATRRPTSRTPT